MISASRAASLLILVILSVKGSVAVTIEEGCAKNVLRITTTMVDGQRRPGFAFVVGERERFLYAVTANHVVRDDLPGAIAKDIQVEALGVSSPFKAELLGVHEDKPIDVAVLRIPRPNGFAWERDCYPAHELSKSEGIFYVGRDRQWFVPTTPGSIVEPSRLSGLISAQFPISEAPNIGTSGGPAFSAAGFIGMVIATESNGVTSITSIRSIKALFDRTPQLQECWKLVRRLTWRPGLPGSYTFEQLKNFLGEQGKMVVATDFHSGPEPFTQFNGPKDKVFVSNNHLFYRREHDDCSQTGWFIPNLELENFYLHVKARMVTADLNSNPGFGVIFKHKDNRNDYGFGAPMPAGPKSKLPRPNGCLPGGDNGYFVLFRFIEGIQTKTLVNAATALGQTYGILLRFLDGWLTIYIDGRKVYEGQELGLTKGQIGLGVGGVGEAEFTDVVVIDIDAGPVTRTSDALHP